MSERSDKSQRNSGLNIELNACMGGMSEGFRRAGVQFDLAVDYDPNACDSHERNIGLRPVMLDIRDLVRMARIGAFRPSVNLFVADPPCTPWSMAGDRKGLDDERDLLRETVELLDLLRPATWLIGNVPGIDKADNWANVVVPVIYEPMRRAGYCIDYSSFNAADYGTPQCRVRPIWFGHPVGTPCIRWEAPTHAPAPVLPGVGLKPWVSCGTALEDAFGPRSSWGAEVGRSVRLRRRGKTVGKKTPGKKPRASSPCAPAGVVTSKQNQGDGSVIVYDIHHPPSRVDEPGFVVRVGSGGGANRSVDLGVSERLPDPNLPFADPAMPHRTVSRVADQAILADELRDAGLLDRPATTLGARDEMTAPGHHDPNVSGSGNSGILLSEAALLVIQGFPKTWHVAGKTKTARMSQIGQAMPPQLSESWAVAYVRWLECSAEGVSNVA